MSLSTIRWRSLSFCSLCSGSRSLVGANTAGAMHSTTNTSPEKVVLNQAERYCRSQSILFDYAPISN